MVTEVDRHLIHSWQNFLSERWGSTDTCWHFIYVMLIKRKKVTTKQQKQWHFSCSALAVLCEVCVSGVIMEKNVWRDFFYIKGEVWTSCWLEISPLCSMNTEVSVPLPCHQLLCDPAQGLGLSSSQGERSRSLHCECPFGLLRILGAFPTHASIYPVAGVMSASVSETFLHDCQDSAPG